MTTYQTMTFGTGGKAGSIQQVSQQTFYESFGDPWGDFGWYSLPSYDYGSAWDPGPYYDPTPQRYVDVPAYLSGPVGVPSAPAKIFDAKNPKYDIVPGKQQGALNDPRTVQGADGYFYTVTRTGTDQYDIKRVDSPTAIAGPAENTIVFSPAKDVQVAVQEKQGNLVPVQLVRSDKQGSETFILSDEMSEDEVSEAYESILDIILDAGNPFSSPSVYTETEEAFVNAVKPKKSSPPSVLTETEEAFVNAVKPKKPSLVPSWKVRPSDEDIVENIEWVVGEDGKKRKRREDTVLHIQSLYPAAPGGEGEEEEGPGDESGSPPSGESPKDQSYANIMPDVLGFGDRSARAAAQVVESRIMPRSGEATAYVQEPSYSEDPFEGYTGEEGKRRLTFEFLTEHKDEIGITDAQAFTISTHFYPWASQMYQQGYNLGDLADLADWYDGLINGDPDAFNQLGSVSVRGAWGPGEFHGFFSLTPEQQQAAIVEYNQKLLEREAPPQAIQLFNAGIYAKLGEDDKGDDTRYWMAHDGILIDINKDWSWNAKEDVKDFLASKEGQAAIGGGLAIAGIGIGFLAAGPAGAAVGAKFGATAGGLTTAAAYGTALSGVATLPFAVTELPQMFQTSPYLTKAQLQEKGHYGRDRDTDANQLHSSTKSAIDNLKFNTNTDDKLSNLSAIDGAKQSLADYGNFIVKEGFLLLGAGTFDKHVTEYNNLKNAFNIASSSYGPDGTWSDPKAKATKVEFHNMREGYRVEFLGKDYQGKGVENTEFFKQPVSGVALVYDPEGKLIGSEKISLYADGKDKIVDIGSIIEQASLYNRGGGGSGVSSKATSGKTTITIPPGIYTEYNGQKLSGGSSGKSYDIPRTDNAPLRLTFKAEDGSKKELTEYIGFPTSGWNAYSVNPDLKGSAPLTVEGFQTYLAPGQRLYWQDLDITGYIDPETGKVAMPGPGYYMISIVNPDGTKTSKNVYVGAGTFNTLSLGDVAYKPAAKQTSSYGGGGGGGGRGGSSYRSTSASAAKTASASVALIIYGETCRDATIWQDDVEVAPEIGKSYSISPGYHSVKVEKYGKKPWTKTVYCMANDTITVSPAFEDLDVVNSPTEEEPDEEEQLKRVFVNSNPSGAKVLINGAASGQWTPCFFDLPEGYYLFTIQKSGYDAYDIKCYVGEVIAWNEQASALARSRGWL